MTIKLAPIFVLQQVFSFIRVASHASAVEALRFRSRKNQEEVHEAYARKTCRPEGRLKRARCHRRRRHGSARLAAEGARRATPATRNSKSSRPRHRSPDPPRQRHSARSRVGTAGRKPRAKNAGLLLAYEKTGYDKTGPGRLPDLLDHWSRPAPERSRRRLYQDPALLHAVRSREDQRHQARLGGASSATSAAPTTFRSSSNSSATKKAPTRRVWSTRRRSRRS